MATLFKKGDVPTVSLVVVRTARVIFGRSARSGKFDGTLVTFLIVEGALSRGPSAPLNAAQIIFTDRRLGCRRGTPFSGKKVASLRVAKVRLYFRTFFPKFWKKGLKFFGFLGRFLAKAKNRWPYFTILKIRTARFRFLGKMAKNG